MVRRSGGASIESTVSDYASVYEDDESYANYYAKWGSGSSSSGSNSYDDYEQYRSYDEGEQRGVDDRRDMDDFSAADSYSSVETPTNNFDKDEFFEEYEQRRIVNAPDVSGKRNKTTNVTKAASKKNISTKEPKSSKPTPIVTSKVVNAPKKGTTRSTKMNPFAKKNKKKVVEPASSFKNKAQNTKKAMKIMLPPTQTRSKSPELPAIESVITPSYSDEESAFDSIVNKPTVEIKNNHHDNNSHRRGYSMADSFVTEDASDDGDRMMNASDLDTVVDSVMSELMKGHSSRPVDEDSIANELDDDEDEYYEDFMNAFQNKTSTIMSKKSKALSNLTQKPQTGIIPFSQRPPRSIKSNATRSNIPSSYKPQNVEHIAHDMPPVELKGPAEAHDVKEVGEEQMELRGKANVLLMKRKFGDLVEFVQMYPSIVGIQSQQSQSRNLIHVMALQQIPVPENVLLKVISVDPSLVSVSDETGNTPLHYAALHANKQNMHVFLVLLKFHPLGVNQRNKEGDLPLHLAAANPNKGAQMAVHMLLETNTKALTEPNKKGKIPLHLALTAGSSNLKSLKTIINVHKARKYSVVVKDNKGNTPLHSAILSGTSYQAVELFNRMAKEVEPEAYTKQNDQRCIPLHLALMMKRVNPLVVLSIIKAAPFAAGMPTPSGSMPIHLATKAELKPEIIKTILTADMPIEIGNKTDNPSMGIIINREHGHSWWHVAVEKGSRYVDVVTSLLEDFATYVQIVALARSVGPDKKTATINAASPPLVDAFKNMLRFYYRYEISTQKMPVCRGDVQSFPAYDHGADLEKFKVTGPWLKSGFTKIKENNRATAASERGREIMYIPWQPDEKEITLRCYALEETFLSEKRIRETKDISSEYVERIVSVHNDSSYVNPSFTTGKIMCIAFERNDGTLGEIMSGNNSIREQAGWLSNCQSVVRDLATCLKHMHENGVVHSRLDMNSFGRFNGKWKLMTIGSSTLMGTAMGGLLNKCATPESLSGVQAALPAPAISASKGRQRSRSKGRWTSSSSLKTGNASTKHTSLPPLNANCKPERKKFGVFVFGLKDLGLGTYGSSKKAAKKSSSNISIGDDSMDSSIASMQEGSSLATDEASARVIAMQEDEISRLRKALEEKEHIYRKQLAEERATFKRQEAERQRELKNKEAKQKIQRKLPKYAPERLMASPSWDIFSLGLVMAESIIGSSPLLPSSTESDEELLELLSRFDEAHVDAICAEVQPIAGELAADLVARLLHPKPQSRIANMEKVLQHKYFHAEVIEPSNARKFKKSKGSVKLSTTISRDKSLFSKGSSRRRSRSRQGRIKASE